MITYSVDPFSGIRVGKHAYLCETAHTDALSLFCSFLRSETVFYLIYKLEYKQKQVTNCVLDITAGGFNLIILFYDVLPI